MTTIPKELVPRVAAIDEQIEGLVRQIAQLQISRSQLLSSHAPIRKIPPEIIAHIISTAISAPFLLSPKKDAANLQPLFDAALVCRLWRDIIHSYPALWSRILVAPGYGRSLKWIQLFLSRSGTAPLEIYCDFREYLDGDPGDVAVVTKCAGGLTPAMSRCRKLTLITGAEPFLDSFFSLAQPGPLLSELSIHSTNSATEVPVQILDHTEGLPNVQALVLNRVTCRNWQGVTMPNLRTIVFCSSFQLPIHKCLQGLSGSPHLTTLRFESCAFSVDDDTLYATEETRVYLPSLASLQLWRVQGMDQALILETVDAPKLKAVHITCSLNNDSDLCWFAAANNALTTVEELRFENLRIKGAAISAVIRMFSRLRELRSLRLVASQPTQQFFEALGRTPVLPELKDLVLKRCGGVTGHEIVRFVESRHRLDGVCRLENVEFRGCSTLDHDSVESLRGVVNTVVHND
jgi:F-box-like